MTGLLQLMLLVSTALASEPSSPVCSKFDYEEKLLDKMIRMEFAFEQLSNRMGQDLKDIREEKERLQAVVDVMKDQQKQAERRLVSLMEEVERNQSSTLESVVTESNNTLEQISAAFNDIKDKAIIPSVYFNARSPQTSTLSTGEVIVYKTVETNQGNGYSSTTGKFTSPVQGLFLFHTQTCTPASKYAYLAIVKEGSVLIGSSLYEGNFADCSSSLAFVQLEKKKLSG
ncbi:uncharacterized protein LOC128204060 [Mya arenaria]|uniref:uncharacterized protein LOC128204060 n=1 Tax=Mya arenaria TaxID=6604 RepID=UPI0022E40356|nr:uncharacterized protein LOC128204060 [Mya arenaria]